MRGHGRRELARLGQVRDLAFDLTGAQLRCLAPQARDLGVFGPLLLRLGLLPGLALRRGEALDRVRVELLVGQHGEDLLVVLAQRLSGAQGLGRFEDLLVGRILGQAQELLEFLGIHDGFSCFNERFDRDLVARGRQANKVVLARDHGPCARGNVVDHLAPLLSGAVGEVAVDPERHLPDRRAHAPGVHVVRDVDLGEETVALAPERLDPAGVLLARAGLVVVRERDLDPRSAHGSELRDPLVHALGRDPDRPALGRVLPQARARHVLAVVAQVALLEVRLAARPNGEDGAAFRVGHGLLLTSQVFRSQKSGVRRFGCLPAGRQGSIRMDG